MKRKIFILSPKLEKYMGGTPAKLGVWEDDMTVLLRRGGITTDEIKNKYSIISEYRDVPWKFPLIEVLGGLLLVSGILSFLFIF